MITLGVISAIIADIPLRRGRRDIFFGLFLHALSYSVLFPLIYIPLRLLLDDSPGEVFIPVTIGMMIYSFFGGISHLGLDFVTSLCYEHFSLRRQNYLALMTFLFEQLILISTAAFFAARL